MPRLLAVCLAALLLLAATASAQSPRIIGGAPVADGDLPWTVALVQSGARGFLGQFCGGTLVADADGGDSDVVITAAHCVEGATRDDIEVLAGVTELSAATEADYYAVDAIAVAPGTQFPNDDLSGDLAILKLAAPVAGVEPIGGIAPAGDPAGPLRVSGWGDTAPGPASSFPDRMRWVDLSFVDDATCGGVWGGFDAPTMLCAIDPGQDSCNGDSGGPLSTIGASATSGTDWDLVGAVSFGSDFCNQDAFPGVYADLTSEPLRSWALSALDADTTNDPVSQPEYVQGAPTLSGTPTPGSTLTCAIGSTTFTGGAPRTIELNVVRVTPDDYPPVVGGTTYVLGAGDVGQRYACRARATQSVGGGAAFAYSSASDTVRSPTVVEVPGPTVPGPVQMVPGPTVVQNVQVPVPVPTPRVNDTKAPKVSKVSRKCTKQRKCTFTVTTSDAEPSSGVTAMSATATMIRTRSCRKNGRRTVCARLTSRDLTVRRTSDGKFRVTTPKALPRGTHTLVLVAADGNGNVQTEPYRKSFRIR